MLLLDIDEIRLCLGDNCVVNGTNREGVCKKIFDCDKPCADDIDDPFTYCTSSDKTPVVCCPISRPDRTISALSKVSINKCFIDTQEHVPCHLDYISVTSRYVVVLSFYMKFNLLIFLGFWRTECEEYKEYACDITYIANLLNKRPQVQKYSNCAFTIAPLIAGGKEAKRSEFPHMVSVRLVKLIQLLYRKREGVLGIDWIRWWSHCLEMRWHFN